MSAATLERLSSDRLDEGLRDEWASGETPPRVFIMGLHRSGTTILYQFLTRVLPVTPVTVQHVVFFRRLVHSHIADGGAADRDRLIEYLEHHGITRRALDAITLSPETVEEYGWILKREAGAFGWTDRTRGVFDDLCRKLRRLDPGSSALLLKNPWDTARSAEIARAYPDARFVFLLRDPIEILNSELRNAMSFSAERNALVQLLTQGVPQVRFYLGLARTVRRVVGDRRAERFLIRWLFKDIVNNLRGMEAAMAEVPADRLVRVRYGGLVDDAPGTLAAVADFLDLPLSDEARALQGQRRAGGLSPAIAEQADALRAEIDREGLGWALGA